MRIRSTVLLASVLVLGGGAAVHAEYLNIDQVSVVPGQSMGDNPFFDLSLEEGLRNIIDAPSAVAVEEHTQDTHVWVVGTPLELDFDLGRSFDLATFHFWNNSAETYDVDNIDLRYFDASQREVGALAGLAPELATTPIAAQDFDLAVLGARYVNVVLSGSNDLVDFQNIGFTGTRAVPLPAAAWTLGSAIAALLAVRCKAGSDHTRPG